MTLQDALIVESPAPDRADKLALYAFLVGHWRAEVRIHPEAGGLREAQGAITAGWVLQGRAIQDVWDLPGVFHGSTFRIYDPAIDAWRIHWLDPVMQAYPRMIGRAKPGGVQQDGVGEAGDRFRWSFNEITPTSFHWKAHVSPPGSDDWRLQIEFLARRA